MLRHTCATTRAPVETPHRSAIEEQIRINQRRCCAKKRHIFKLWPGLSSYTRKSRPT